MYLISTVTERRERGVEGGKVEETYRARHPDVLIHFPNGQNARTGSSQSEEPQTQRASHIDDSNPSPAARTGALTGSGLENKAAGVLSGNDVMLGSNS